MAMQYCIPELGEGIYEAELVQWHVQSGQSVQMGQNLAEVVTDKATMELPAPFAGTIDQLLVEAGTTLHIGDPILAYTEVSASNQSEATDAGQKTHVEAVAVTEFAAVRSATGVSPSSRSVARSAPGNGSGTISSVRAAPSVRRMARILEVDLRQVSGSGPDGRILIEDLAKHVPHQSAAQPAPTKKRNGARPILDLGVAGTRVPIRGVRRRVAENMSLSKKVVPHYSYVDECDVTEMLKLARSIKRPLVQRGIRLTNLAFFVKAVTAALQEIPIVNASIDDESAEIVLHDHYHIGIATTTDKGLTVPVIHDAERRDLVEIAGEIDRLTRAVRDGRMRPQELQGGTFTISAVGTIGGMVTTPIINHPEAGILGIGRTFRRPVYDDADNLVPAHIVYLSFSFDHRIVDGSVGATFGNAVIRHLSSPATMLLPIE